MGCMCPPDYRLPEMSGFGRDTFAALLGNELQKSKPVVQRATTNEWTQMPFTLMPKVEEDLWNKWNELFDSLDHDKNGAINAEELGYSGLLSRDVAEFVMAKLATENGF